MLYKKLDVQPRKVNVLLSADLLPRVLSTTAKARLEALKKLLSESEAPEDLRLTVILSEDAVVLTGLSRHEWALISCKSGLICINELFPGIGNFWVC